MSSPFRVSMLIVFFAVSSLAMVTAKAEYGPFMVESSPIENMTFTYRVKLEAPTLALDVANHNPGGTTLVDGVLTLESPAVVQTQVQDTDPATGQPKVDPSGNPVMVTKTITLPVGQPLNPKTVPADNYLLPKGVTVATQATANGNYSIGRFGYLGVAPRFKPEELEMFASKMGHSLRVKGWVTQDLLDTYEFTLLDRLNSYAVILSKETIHLVPLRNIQEKADRTTNADLKKWYQVASFYSKDLFNDPDLLKTDGIDLYPGTVADEWKYKEDMLHLMAQIYFRDPSATLDTAHALYVKYLKDPNFYKTRREASTALFKAHFQGLYVEGPRVPPTSPITPILPPTAPGTPPAQPPMPDPANPHANALGFVTFVYPIAIDKEGPFKLPKPGLRHFPLSVSMEGRTYSNRWLDEFGGFPFIQITDDGVAFHGPITMSDDGLTWALHRDNVSHSCMRMDASDLMELRAILPENMKQLQKLKKTIPLWITEWPDVSDVDNNGTNEVIDVAYYAIPYHGSQIVNPANWAPSVYNKTYWKKMFAPYVGKLASKNTFALTATGAEFTGLPRYEVVGGAIQATGYYTETLPIRTFAQRPTQIIQFREDGITYNDVGDHPEDHGGMYPMGVVNKFGKRLATKP